MWSIDGPQGHESAKIASIAVPYLQGKCLDIGCGTEKVWPGLIGIDSCFDYGGQRPPAVDIVGQGDDLSMFADKSCDGVFSSHFLEHVVDYKACLKEWWRVIKPGGYLVLYLPHKELYPNIGQPGSNPDHKHDFMPTDIIAAMKEVGSWELLENERREKDNEYSFYQVYRKKTGKNVHQFKVWERNPEGQKRCLVIRYGAIGDALLMASIFPELKKQGYHITLNCSNNTIDVLRHDPHIDEFWFQEKDFVPNVQLGPYWETIAHEKRYDKIINLCESIEGGLLTLPGRLQHEYPLESRQKLFGTVNYMERTHDIAGVPHVFHTKFYSTEEEKTWAKKAKADYCKGEPCVVWAINGSAAHKVYPYTQIVCAWLMEHSNVHVFLLADKFIGKGLQDGIVGAMEKDGISTKRIHPMAGVWDIRQALSFAQVADCVVGPETGTLQAMALEENAKVIYLSHSSHENLTKHWKNTIVLEADRAKAPCSPCHRLQYNWQFCHQVDSTKAALCTSNIRAETLFDAIIKALKLQKMDVQSVKQATLEKVKSHKG